MTKIIHTYNPEEEIWHYIEKLTNSDYVHKLLKYRINNEFFNVGKQTNYSIDFKKINNIKTAYPVETYEPLSSKDSSLLQVNISEIVTDAIQAVEVYKASKSVTINSKPILLYYSFIMLARILFLATYKKNYNKLPRSDTHGLDFLDQSEVKCMRIGAFPRFHDSFSSSPEIYLNELKFSWVDLLKHPTRKFEMEYNFDEHKLENKIEFSISNTMIDELTREILFLYSMSMLARYSPISWIKIVNKTEYGHKIVEYMRTVQSLFPNMVFNYLHGEDYNFYPESRFVGDKEHYEPQF